MNLRFRLFTKRSTIESSLAAAYASIIDGPEFQKSMVMDLATHEERKKGYYEKQEQMNKDGGKQGGLGGAWDPGQLGVSSARISGDD